MAKLEAVEDQEEAAKAAQAAFAEAAAQFEELISLDGFIDVDVLVPPDVEYRVRDTAGEEQVLIIPGDLPFPYAVAFMDRRDDWLIARERYAAARGHGRDEARAGQVHTRAWARMIDAFVPIVQLRQPERDRSFLEPGLGEAALRHFMQAVWMRLMLHRLGEAFFSAGEGTDIDARPVEASPPKARSRRRKASSG